MAINVYECDTCKRQIEKIRNEEGLTVFGKCVITQGCLGQLHLKEMKMGTITKPPKPAAGLEDWTPRKVLYTHTQRIPLHTWRIKHNLQSDPTVQVYITDNPEDLKNTYEITPKTIDLVNENVLTITLPDGEGQKAGVAQCIARSSAKQAPVTTSTDEQDVSSSTDFKSMTDGVTLTIAIKKDSPGNTAPSTKDIELNVFDKDTGNMVTEKLSLNNVPSSTAWSQVSTILVNNIFFDVYQGQIPLDRVDDQNGFWLAPADDNNDDFDPSTALMLLSSYPHDQIDRIVDQYLDLSNVTEKNATTYFAFDGETILINANQLTKTYPSIKII